MHDCGGDFGSPVDGEGARLASRVRTGWWAIALLLALLAVAISSLLLPFPPLATASPPPPQARQPEQRMALSPTHGNLQVRSAPPLEYRMALLSSEVQVQGDHAVFAGLVRNLMDRPISGVGVVVTLYDEDGVPRLARDALVDLDPLPSGQVSRWQVSIKDHPELPLYAVEFREWHVGGVLTRDDRSP